MRVRDVSGFHLEFVQVGAFGELGSVSLKKQMTRTALMFVPGQIDTAVRRNSDSSI